MTLSPHSTFGGFCPKWIFKDACCHLTPSILHGRLGNHSIVQALLRPEVIPQIFHRFDMVLLFRGKYGIECLQLNTATRVKGRKGEERT